MLAHAESKIILNPIDSFIQVGYSGQITHLCALYTFR